MPITKMTPEEFYNRLHGLDLPLTENEWNDLVSLYEEVAIGITDCCVIKTTEVN